MSSLYKDILKGFKEIGEMEKNKRLVESANTLLKETDLNKINILEELNKMDQENYQGLVNMYESLNVSPTYKKTLVSLISKGDKKRIVECLNKLYEKTYLKEDEDDLMNNDIEDITVNTFNRTSDLYMVAENIDVIGPDYYGAPQPPFNPIKINESNIPHKMRFKQFDVEVNEEDINTIDFLYITQETFSREDITIFLKEVKRAIKELLKNLNYIQPFTLNIDLGDRDGYNSYNIRLNFNDGEDKEIIKNNLDLEDEEVFLKEDFNEENGINDEVKEIIKNIGVLTRADYFGDEDFDIPPYDFEDSMFDEDYTKWTVDDYREWSDSMLEGEDRFSGVKYEDEIRDMDQEEVYSIMFQGFKDAMEDTELYVEVKENSEDIYNM